MKRDSKRNRRIRNLVLVCVLSALLLTVGTYAWFIGMQTVKVNSFEVKIAGVDSLMLSLDGTSWATSIDVSSAKQYLNNANEFLDGDKEGLKPISTIGEFDSDASRLKLYEKGSLTATKGGYRILASKVQNTAEKEGCEAMGFEMLTDMFAQPEEFDLLPYSALWAYQQPQELTEQQNTISDISWPGLVKCVSGTEEEFDANWDNLVNELEENGLADTEKAVTEFLATKLVNTDK